MPSHSFLRGNDSLVEVALGLFVGELGSGTIVQWMLLELLLVSLAGTPG